MGGGGRRARMPLSKYTRVTGYVFPFMNIWASPGTYSPGDLVQCTQYVSMWVKCPSTLSIELACQSVSCDLYLG